MKIFTTQISKINVALWVLGKRVYNYNEHTKT